MYAHHSYHRLKKKNRKTAVIFVLAILLILFLLKENTGLWETLKLHGKIACYQDILELYLPGAVYNAKGEEEDNFAETLFQELIPETDGEPSEETMAEESGYQTQVESDLSYEDILAREAADENYVDENGNLVEAGTVLEDSSETGTSPPEETAAGEETAGTTEGQVENPDSEGAAPLGESEQAENQTQQTTAETAVLAAEQKVVYSREKLNDFDYLLQNFYQVDNTTTINGSQLNADSLLGKDMRLSHDASTPQILIYHTHSQEGYKDSVPGDAATSVVGVGDYLTKLLTERYGFSVIHHKGEYDVGDRDHAYSKAAPALEQVLAENPSIEVVIDLHRDGVREDTRLVTEINGVEMAQVMFFNGLSRTTKMGDIDYLHNPYIADNLSISFQMQLKAAEYYPDFTRRIYLKGYRYNMHYCPKSLLIEVGAQTNTVQEAMNAMIPLADILNKVLTAQQ